jgi:hypothetical protein
MSQQELTEEQRACQVFHAKYRLVTKTTARLIEHQSGLVSHPPEEHPSEKFETPYTDKNAGCGKMEVLVYDKDAIEKGDHTRAFKRCDDHLRQEGYSVFWHPER